MKVLVVGAYGMLGHKLVQVLGQKHEVFATCRRNYPQLLLRGLQPERLITGVTTEDFDSVIAAHIAVRPDVTVNCVGIVKQHPDAQRPLAALQVNAVFPHRLALACQSAGSRLVHFSTDCVFSGRKGSYRETDVCDAHDLYGRTKCLGEVNEQGCVTIRSSIIGPELRASTGLVEWCRNQRGQKVKGYRNVTFSGFTTWEMAHIVERIIEDWRDLSGIWHVSAQPITKHDLLHLINRRLDLGIEILADQDYHCDRTLIGARFAEATGYLAPSWEAMIDQMSRDMEANAAVRL